MRSRIIVRASLSLAVAAGLLCGCASSGQPPLYQWTGYQPEVYEYFKGKKSTEEQIAALEKALREIRAQGNMPPPGFHAHLGMLYANAGKDGEALQQFRVEKQLFPESSTFMDFLLKKSG